MKPTVSICMVTYNQEKYITQAIDSVLMQETDFDYEIVIGEDCSTDKTRDIVRKYAEKYPDKIRALLHSYNLGLKGKNNFVATFKSCQGKYIAILEGDDYWTSPCKLQKQVDFLNNHTECTICFHSVKVISEDYNDEMLIIPDKTRFNLSAIYTIHDLLKEDFIPTLSVVFRNDLFIEFPEWFFKYITGDYPLHLINAHYGDIGYIDEIMGIYRIHNSGAFQIYTNNNIKYLLDLIGIFCDLNIYFNYQYDKEIRQQIQIYVNSLIIASEKNKGKEYLFKFREFLNYYVFFKNLLRLYMPSLCKSIRSMKNIS